MFNATARPTPPVVNAEAAAKAYKKDSTAIVVHVRMYRKLITGHTSIELVEGTNDQPIFFQCCCSRKAPTLNNVPLFSKDYNLVHCTCVCMQRKVFGNL